MFMWLSLDLTALETLSSRLRLLNLLRNEENGMRDRENVSLAQDDMI